MRPHLLNISRTHVVSSTVLSVALSIRKATVVGMALLFMNACSDKPTPATQIAAKVNDDEITVHQLNNAIAKLPAIPPENLASVRMDLLNKLVNEQLAVQQAMEHKLDRSAEVMMQIEAAKREILTKAYLKEVISKLPKVNPDEAKQFYNSHPELFAERKVYNLQQITIAKPHPPVAEIQQLIAGKSMADIAAALKEKNIVFLANVGTRAAEQIPLSTLAELSKVKDGQTSVIESPQALTIVKVNASQAAPLSEEVALERIPPYLMNERAKLAVNEKINQLKNTSKITYMNEFAAAGKQVAAAPKPETKTTKGDSVERGIAGLN